MKIRVLSDLHLARLLTGRAQRQLRSGTGHRPTIRERSKMTADTMSPSDARSRLAKTGGDRLGSSRANCAVRAGLFAVFVVPLHPEGSAPVLISSLRHYV